MPSWMTGLVMKLRAYMTTYMTTPPIRISFRFIGYPRVALWKAVLVDGTKERPESSATRLSPLPGRRARPEGFRHVAGHAVGKLALRHQDQAKARFLQELELLAAVRTHDGVDARVHLARVLQHASCLECIRDRGDQHAGARERGVRQHALDGRVAANRGHALLAQTLDALGVLLDHHERDVRL